MSTSSPDIRIVRLVVSIATCGPLNSYYFNTDAIAMACEYHGLRYRPIIGPPYALHITRDTLAYFFSQLHLEDPQKFAGFMNYTLTDIFRFQGSLDEWIPEVKVTFGDFLRDLNALGYRLGAEGVTLAIGTEAEESKLMGELEQMLVKIDPELLKIHQGAWSTLLSESPDRDRQAIASARELLNHTLDSVGGEGTRKERVSKIIGEQDAETVEAVVKLVNALYGLQSKGTHKEPSFERAFFVIKLTEYVLYYLLKSISKQSD